MIRHMHITDPVLLWIILFAVLTTQVSWPAATWRGITIAVCWIVCLLVIILQFVR